MQEKVDEIAMHIQQTEVQQEGRSNSEPKIQPNYFPCGQGITDTCIIVGHNCNFMQRARLGERMLNEQTSVVQTTAQMLQEICRKAASGLGSSGTGRQE